MLKDTPYRRQPNLPKPEPVDSGHDAAWLDEERRATAFEFMKVLIYSEEIFDAIVESARTLGTTQNELLAFQAFSMADAMMTEAMRSPEARAAQREMWQRGSKGGDA